MVHKLQHVAIMLRSILRMHTWKLSLGSALALLPSCAEVGNAPFLGADEKDPAHAGGQNDEGSGGKILVSPPSTGGSQGGLTNPGDSMASGGSSSTEPRPVPGCTGLVNMPGMGGASSSPEVSANGLVSGVGLPQINVEIENIDYPGAEGKEAVMAGTWLKERYGEPHNWNNDGTTLGPWLKDTVTGGRLSFTTYFNPEDENLDFKIFQEGTWTELVSGGENIVISLKDYGYGSVADLHIDASGLSAGDTGSLVTTLSPGSGVSDFKDLGTSMRMITFAVHGLPAAFNGTRLSLAGEGVLNRHGEDRSWWKDAPSLTQTVVNEAVEFTFYTTLEQARFKLITSGTDPYAPRVQDARGGDPECYILTDLSEYEKGEAVLIEWDAGASYSITLD